MTMKPWREVAIPHEDVHRGTFVRAEFAADITRVHDGSATPEYQDPVLFFQRTFITEGMGALLTSVAKRLAGKGGDPVIQLQTAFGGGKTHTMLAVMHMVSGKAPKSDLAGIPRLLDAADILDLPTAKVVTYEIDVTRVINRKLVVAQADARTLVDGREIYTAKDLRVGLFTSTESF